MVKFSFDDYVASLSSKMKEGMQEDRKNGHITQEQIDRFDFFELSVIDLEPEQLKELMNQAFKAGKNSI